MENYLEKIKIKLKKNIKIEEIDIVDNSHLHSKHKFFDKNKKHLKIIIKSNFLKNLKKIESHKKIMEILKNDLKEKIQSQVHTC